MMTDLKGRRIVITNKKAAAVRPAAAGALTATERNTNGIILRECASDQVTVN